MEILKVEGLTKSFGGLVAVNNLDFNVEDGEIIGLIGPNGSGKTTVLNLITGFHKHTAGRITYRGRVVTGEGHTDEKWWFDVHYVDGELRISE